MFGPRGAGASRSSDDLHNEDSFLVADRFGLYAVCDGRGSAPAGEVAAEVAVDAIEHFLEGLLQSPDDAEGASPADAPERPEISIEIVEQAMRHALEALVVASGEHPELEGMETTLTLLLIQRGRAFIGHSGDSRAYLVRAGRLVQLTTDQEWTSHARHGSRSDTSDRPDASDAPVIESFSIETRRGDTFVLCTDGAESEVANPDLVESMEEYSPRLIASRIVAAAHRHDPTVDATVVVVRIHQDADFAWAREVEPIPLETPMRARINRRAGRPSQSPYVFDVFDRPLARRSAADRLARTRSLRTTTNA